jgi:CP family cyanate transporter-like MFS transporter
VCWAGSAAALHVGKLPPALPVLREALGISLVEAGFLLSLVQLAGMTLGLRSGPGGRQHRSQAHDGGGPLAHRVRQPRGGCVSTPGPLLALRALEGLGFLLGALPAPALIRRLVPPERLSAMLGLWGAFMPVAATLALLFGPAWIAWAGWPAWWWLLGAFSLVMAAWLALVLPQDPRGAHLDDVGTRVRQTLGAPGPWLVALAFGAYSSQWLAVIGFLPSIYSDAGVAGLGRAGTTLAAAVNIVGNVASGRLLQRGVPAPRLLASASWRWGSAACWRSRRSQARVPRARCCASWACCPVRHRWRHSGHAVLAGGAARARTSAPSRRRSAGCSSGRPSASSPAPRWWPGSPRAPAAGSGAGS